jgi:hypothetical protein
MEILSVIKYFLTDATQESKWHSTVKGIGNLERSHLQAIETINEIYNAFPDKVGISPEGYEAYLKSKFPSRDHTAAMDVINSAMSTTIGKNITQKLLGDLIERQCATKSAAVNAAIVSNQKSGGWAEKQEALLQDYYDMVANVDRPDQLQDCDMSFEDAIIYRATDSGVKWPIGMLTKYLGGVEPSLGLIIARPETGKTSFILNSLAYFAAQLRGTDTQLLYLNNEEGIIGIKARFGVSLLGCETQWAEENPKAFGQAVAAKNGNCVRFHGGVRSTRDAETLIKRYNPMVTVLDQASKFVLPGNKEEGPVGKAVVLSWFREKAQVYGTMIMGVMQAGATAKQWLTMADVNGSKTDVPGESDWAFGIGLVDEPGMEDIRFFNIFRNKMKYGRKGRCEATFNASTCRYTDRP